MILRISFFCLCLCLALPAHAEEYISVTWPDLLHTAIRFNALDLSTDNDLVDEYAAITDCELYQFYFKDDFKWNQVRSVIRKSVEANKSTYPGHYRFDAKFRLGRYDFDAKLYRFAGNTSIGKFNSIVIFDFAGPICENQQAKYLPLNYRAILNPEISIPGLPLEPKAAQALMHYMDASENEEHAIFARFNMTVLYIEPLRKFVPDPGVHNAEIYYYQTENDKRSLHIDVRVDSVDFYGDPEMSKLVYTFKPS